MQMKESWDLPILTAALCPWQEAQNPVEWDEKHKSILASYPKLVLKILGFQPCCKPWHEPGSFLLLSFPQFFAIERSYQLARLRKSCDHSYFLHGLASGWPAERIERFKPQFE